MVLSQPRRDGDWHPERQLAHELGIRVRDQAHPLVAGDVSFLAKGVEGIDQ
jgi:hypothetical protein